MVLRKKVDARIRTLIENSVKTRHRSFFVLVGDRGKDQVVNLHYILSKTRVKARPSVLWCYKKELGFSTHKQKRIRQIKKQQSRGMLDPSVDDPFELFIGSTDIRWCYYKDTQKILGTTWGMCVLQDFEALSPNMLARTVETVEGGGIVVLLLRTMSSLKQLYSMTMDVHSRLRSGAMDDVVPRFNERFILSLSANRACCVCDDELNILPISKHIRKIVPLVEPRADGDEEEGGGAGEGAGGGAASVSIETEALRREGKELADLQRSLVEAQPVGSLVNLCRTLDQAQAVMSFTQAVGDKRLRNTVSLMAARGRGKSAALGLSIAAAVAHDYSNIFLTAPSPENLGTVFDFLLRGLAALHFKEHADFDVVQSANPAFNKAIIRINIFRGHRQTVQYIQPQDSAMLAQAELLVIDEAAAIPLPLVRKLLGPYLVFISSTVNGYEGTGRSLSLKLLAELRAKQGAAAQAAAAKAAGAAKGNAGGGRQMERQLHEERWRVAGEAAAATLDGSVGRTLVELSLETPIRYGSGDPLEQWVNDLLCLDVKTGGQRLVSGTPAPSDCSLYYVDRDALFSYHKLSEKFLQRMMALYVASHYKNQPNDLQLMSDAPAHQLYVLLGPAAEGGGGADGLPDILCVIQVALEGKITRGAVQAALARGDRPDGDLIPWTLSQQFQDEEFAALSGARVVRIATHPDVSGMGYGTRALQQLIAHFQGELAAPGAPGQAAEVPSSLKAPRQAEEEEEGGAGGEGGGLLREKVKPRKKLPPLLTDVAQCPAQRLHYIGTSFGLTAQLLRFWQRQRFEPVYVRQTRNDLTGEHSSILLRALKCDDLPESPAAGWLDAFSTDARRRFLTLFGYDFRSFETALALALVTPSGQRGGTVVEAAEGAAGGGALTASEAGVHFLPHDMKRLQAYCRNLVDFHMVVDLLPALARLHFSGRLSASGGKLSVLQSVILLGLGLQHKSVEQLQAELTVPMSQMLALFNKAMRKLSTQLNAIHVSACRLAVLLLLPPPPRFLISFAHASAPFFHSFFPLLSCVCVRARALVGGSSRGGARGRGWRWRGEAARAPRDAVAGG